MVQQVKKIKVDDNKIKMAIQSGIPLTITTYTLPHEMEEYIAEVLKSFLIQLNQTQMIDSLSYCIKELTNNSKKANTKRVYFVDKKLDINNRADYGIGMKNFKQDTLNNIKYYLEQQRKKGYYIKVLFQSRNNKIKIEVRNKAELTVYEYKRIHDKITRAQQFSSVEEGLTQLLDDSEGAGLGLVIMMLVLRKIGLTDDNYQVLSENGETITRLILPFSKDVTEQVDSLSKEFVELIDALPEFPENIAQVNRVISDPKSRMSDIAACISSDVSLTAELLKMVNSAAYVLQNPCSDIATAVKTVGTRGIRNLLFSIGSMQNLVVKDSEKNRRLWDHAYRVAFYAYNLARNFCTAPADRACIEDAYVCGLLHDMGKIIFETAHPDLLAKVNKICADRNVSQNMFETMIAGVNHGEVGALIAEKWNFPPVISDVIRYHHDPELAPENVRKLSFVIYLSDMIAHYGMGEVTFDQISPAVLSHFKISSEDQLLGISDRLRKSFRKGS